jgi:NAD(P)-dependent dehydrogenase (short-subunit alcohol dehydrogenase family)
VTGASSGIGRAIAVDLARRGVMVFAGVRTRGTAPAQADLRGPVCEVLIDVTDRDQIAEAAEFLPRQLAGRQLRGVVNNAGIAVGGPLEYLDVDEVRRQFEVNVFGQLAVTQAVLGLLRAHGDGRIVFLGSVGGHVAAPCFGPYAASKHALRAIADALRRELRPWHIHVSTLTPGAVATPIWQRGDEFLQDLIGRLPDRAMTLYGGALEDARHYVSAAAGGRSISSAAVVRPARHALFARRPRPTYLIGAEARAGVIMSTFLPAGLFDALLARQLSRPLHEPGREFQSGV